MRAAIYTRVSQDRTGGERSVTEQEAECRAVCQREGWDVVRVFPDNDRSASRYARKSRPKFEELREFIAARGCDILLYWEASRSTRDLGTFVELRDLCRGQDVKLSYSGRLYDLSNTQDQFMTGFDALMSEHQSAQTSDRVRRAVRANAAAGRPHGRNLFGYRRVYEERTGQLISVELDEVEAAMLREAARRVIAGDTLRSVYRWMNDSGSRTLAGNEWRSLNLRRCLTHPGYLGKRVLHGKVVGDAVWPAMYDEDTHAQLCAILNDPARRSGAGSSLAKHLLSNIAVCGRPECGATMRVGMNNGHLAYMCSGCTRVGRRKEPVDRTVVDALLAGLADPEMTVFGVEPDTAVADGARAAREAAVAKRARLQTFYDAAAEGEITAAALARIEAKLLGEIEQHERAARRASVPVELRHLADVDIPMEWKRLPIATQRALIRHCMVVTILPWGRGRRVFSPESVRIEWLDVRSEITSGGRNFTTTR